MLVYFFNLNKLSKPLNQYSQLEEMLALRKMGYSYTVLADKYKVPKTTIRYLCRKFGLANNVETLVIRHIVTTTLPKQDFYNEREEKINTGKSYAEYLKEERERKWRKLTQNRLHSY